MVYCCKSLIWSVYAVRYNPPSFCNAQISVFFILEIIMFSKKQALQIYFLKKYSHLQINELNKYNLKK